MVSHGRLSTGHVAHAHVERSCYDDSANLNGQTKTNKTMRKLLTIILIATLATTAYGQLDQAIWDSLKTASTDNYAF